MKRNKGGKEHDHKIWEKSDCRTYGFSDVSVDDICSSSFGKCRSRADTGWSSKRRTAEWDSEGCTDTGWYVRKCTAWYNCRWWGGRCTARHNCRWWGIRKGTTGYSWGGWCGKGKRRSADSAIWGRNENTSDAECRSAGRSGRNNHSEKRRNTGIWRSCFFDRTDNGSLSFEYRGRRAVLLWFN